MALIAHTAGSLAAAALLAVCLVLQATAGSALWGALAFALAMLLFVGRWGIDVGVWLDRRLRVSAPAPQP
jgi:Zn-dependent protease